MQNLGTIIINGLGLPGGYMIFLQDGPLPVTLPETKPLTRDNFLS